VGGGAESGVFEKIIAEVIGSAREQVTGNGRK